MGPKKYRLIVFDSDEDEDSDHNKEDQHEKQEEEDEEEEEEEEAQEPEPEPEPQPQPEPGAKEQPSEVLILWMNYVPFPCAKLTRKMLFFLFVDRWIS